VLAMIVTWTVNPDSFGASVRIITITSSIAFWQTIKKLSYARMLAQKWKLTTGATLNNLFLGASRTANRINDKPEVAHAFFA
jgi:hypothetical protein